MKSQYMVFLCYVMYLDSSYTNCLNICEEQGGISSIAFCGISTGLFGFPKKEASDIAFQAIMDWLNENNDVLEHIVFNVYDDESQKLYKEKIIDE